MSDLDQSADFSYSQAVGDLVESVRAIGERARFLAVNLAVIAAKLKQDGTGSARLNEDILDLVARITRVSQDVTDALTAIEKGSGASERTSTQLWHNWSNSGIPDEQTLTRLETSLQETLELSRYIFRWVKELQPESHGRRRRRLTPPHQPLTDERGGED
jgi:hypothetical protein